MEVQIPEAEQERPSSPANCAICLDGISDRAFSNSCLHAFCYACLKDWSKIKAECPLCKITFQSIIHNVRTMKDYDEYQLPEGPPPFRYDQNDQFFTWNVNRNLTLGNAGNGSSGIDQHTLPNLERIVSGNRYLRNPSRYFVYRHNLELFVPPTLGRDRECSPSFYRSNEALIHRLILWANRDLEAIKVIKPSVDVDLVLSKIPVLVKKYPIYSPPYKFASKLRSELGEHALKFTEELYNYAISPYDMYGYMQEVLYSRPEASLRTVVTHPPPLPRRDRLQFLVHNSPDGTVEQIEQLRPLVPIDSTTSNPNYSGPSGSSDDPIVISDEEEGNSGPRIVEEEVVLSSDDDTPFPSTSRRQSSWLPSRSEMPPSSDGPSTSGRPLLARMSTGGMSAASRQSMARYFTPPSVYPAPFEPFGYSDDEILLSEDETFRHRKYEDTSRNVAARRPRRRTAARRESSDSMPRTNSEKDEDSAEYWEKVIGEVRKVNRKIEKARASLKKDGEVSRRKRFTKKRTISRPERDAVVIDYEGGSSSTNSRTGNAASGSSKRRSETSEGSGNDARSIEPLADHSASTSFQSVAENLPACSKNLKRLLENSRNKVNDGASTSSQLLTNERYLPKMPPKFSKGRKNGGNVENNGIDYEQNESDFSGLEENSTSRRPKRKKASNEGLAISSSQMENGFVSGIDRNRNFRERYTAKWNASREKSEDERKAAVKPPRKPRKKTLLTKLNSRVRPLYRDSSSECDDNMPGSSSQNSRNSVSIGAKKNLPKSPFVEPFLQTVPALKLSRNGGDGSYKIENNSNLDLPGIPIENEPTHRQKMRGLEVAAGVSSSAVIGAKKQRRLTKEISAPAHSSRSERKAEEASRYAVDYSKMIDGNSSSLTDHSEYELTRTRKPSIKEKREHTSKKFGPFMDQLNSSRMRLRRNKDDSKCSSEAGNAHSRLLKEVSGGKDKAKKCSRKRLRKRLIRGITDTMDVSPEIPSNANADDFVNEAIGNLINGMSSRSVADD